jgi:cytochrome P450
VRLRPIIEEIVDQAARHLPNEGVVDVAASFARHIPQRVSGALLGLSATDVESVAPWSADAARALSPFIGRRALATIHQSCTSLTQFSEELVDRRRAQPGDDLVSDLLAGQDEHGLSNADVCALVLFVIVASQETTSAVLSAATHLLAEDAARLDELRSAGAWRAAADEAMRLHSPVQMTMRRMTSAIDVSGTRLEAGDHVLAVLAAANRDSRVFPSADRFDLGRPATPPHLAFGGGAHQCPGAALAHVELQSSLRALVERSARLSPAGDLEWQWSLTLRSPSTVPVRFG